ncbi:MAG: biotin--[acetyl-CoA-carboxylase] ligase [Gammaproteobacteria bacterium]|nr:biotin--[acetyl-CoA-carboxylase] ligase [Gammaproteobacteria bacterium]
MVDLPIKQFIETGRIGPVQGLSQAELILKFAQLGLTAEMDDDGIVLIEPGSLLNRQYIEAYLNKNRDIPQHEIQIHRVIESTNDYLKKGINNSKLPTICLTEYQTNGYGRRGSSWSSSYGEDITLSISWNIDSDYSAAGGVSLLFALSVVEFLESVGMTAVEVKWPNDVYISGKKIAGIILEQIFTGEKVTLIVGLGINIMDRKEHFLKNRLKATSIESELGQQNRSLLTAMLIEKLLNTLSNLSNELSFKQLQQWKEHDFLLGKFITVEQNDAQKMSGYYDGIDKTGCLLLNAESKLIKITSGHIAEISS